MAGKEVHADLVALWTVVMAIYIILGGVALACGSTFGAALNGGMAIFSFMRARKWKRQID